MVRKGLEVAINDAKMIRQGLGDAKGVTNNRIRRGNAAYLKYFMNLIVYNILSGRGERYHRVPEGVEQDSAKATAALKLFSQQVDNCNYPSLGGWKNIPRACRGRRQGNLPALPRHLRCLIFHSRTPLPKFK